MKKIFLILLTFFVLYWVSNWDYELETWSKKLVEKYNFSTRNLDNELSRKEFVETLYWWYKDYRTDRRLYVNYDKYTTLDNSKYFVDVDLKSDFWKKLQYLSSIWAFKKNKYFNPKNAVDQKTFFVVLKRLWIITSLNHCKNLQICEKEADNKTYFTKWVYYRYVSKIMDKSLRGYYKKPQDYINNWYKPFLKPSYAFPILWQNLNWCYAYSVRNILKYQYWIWIYVQKADDFIWRQPTQLRNYWNMSKFNKLANISFKEYFSLDTVINSLQAWEPVSVVYWWEYTDWKTWEKKKVKHIVAAYSFDDKWLWVSETISWRRMRIEYDKIFYNNWSVKVWRIFKYFYNPKSTWSEFSIKTEKENNFLVWEI